MDNLLNTLTLNIASNIIYDLAKKAISKTYSIKQLKEELKSCLDIDNAEIQADTIIKFLAESGHIKIKDSKIYADDAITHQSYKNTEIEISNTQSSTLNTYVNVGKNASIKMGGGGFIKQDKDGIVFGV